MAAVTINRQTKSIVFGNRRVKMFNVSCAATGDTLALPGFNLRHVSCDGSGTVAVNASYTAGPNATVTFNYTGGGAANNIDLIAFGF